MTSCCTNGNNNPLDEWLIEAFNRFLRTVQRKRSLLDNQSLLLANKEGHLLVRVSNSTTPNFLQEEHLEYSDWSIGTIGINAVGLAAANASSAIVKGKEHLLPLLADYVTTAVPIHYNSQLIGVLGNLSQLGKHDDVLINLQHLAIGFDFFLDEFQEVIKLEKEIKKNNALLGATKTLYSTFDVSEVLTEAINNIRTFYPNDKLELFLTQEYLVPNVSIKLMTLFPNTHDIIESAFLQTKLIVNKKQISFAKALDEEWEIAVPLKGKQGVYGVIHILSVEPCDYQDEKIEFISNMATIISNAFENAKLYQQSINSVKELQIINELIKRLNQSIDEQSVLNFIVDETAKLVKADLVNVLRVHQENENLLIIASNNTESIGTFFNIDYGYMGLVYKNKESVIISNTNLDKNIDDPYIKGLGYMSLICVPIFYNDEIVGILIVASGEKNHFTYDNLKILQHFSQHVGLTLTNAFLHSKIQQLAITDYLTGLYNRSYFDKKILELQNKDKFGSIILLDIDDFKIVNDSYGHQTGDEILVQVANILQACTRDEDIVCRWGGEELALYLPDTTIELSTKIAERISENIRNKTKPQITVSCGIALWENGDGDKNNLNLIRNADQALYEAKNSGKNQIVIHN